LLWALWMISLAYEVRNGPLCNSVSLDCFVLYD
jgi:hypothetical protein